ncbi:DUF3397 domain-containing protein [Aeribacillus pallidus]|uniref:DUF3397 domain-containing protein n=1 Tax=Aeribacillus pallidus TaxID=33936 RepID=UPI003D1DF995
MSTIVSSILALLITIPIIGYLLVFVIVKQATKNHRTAVRYGIDVTTMILLFAVHYMLLVIFNQSFFWMILIALLVIGIMFVLLHWQVKKEIIISKVLKGYWRLNFLLLSIAYFVLLMYGLTVRVIEAVAPYL